MTDIARLTKSQKIEALNPDTDRWEIATVTGTGEHKGSPVVDVKFENGDEKYLYSHQVR